MNLKISFSDWEYWYSRVYAYFYRRVNNRFDVEELTAKTLNKYFLLENKPKNNAYIWSIARNNLYDFFKQKNKAHCVNIDAYLNQNTEGNQIKLESIPNSNYLNKVAKLRECIKSQINEQDVKIIDLCILDDFSSKEVAEIFNLNPSNVRQRLSRALKKVRQNCKKIWEQN